MMDQRSGRGRSGGMGGTAIVVGAVMTCFGMYQYLLKIGLCWKLKRRLVFKRVYWHISEYSDPLSKKDQTYPSFLFE